MHGGTGVAALEDLQLAMESLRLYPQFIIPLGEGWYDFEIKATTENFKEVAIIAQTSSAQLHVVGEVVSVNNPVVADTEAEVVAIDGTTLTLVERRPGAGLTVEEGATITGAASLVTSTVSSITQQNDYSWTSVVYVYSSVGAYFPNPTWDAAANVWLATQIYWSKYNFQNHTSIYEFNGGSGGSPILQVVFEPSKISGSATWMYAGNENLKWSFVRVGTVVSEVNWNPIIPHAWKSQRTEPNP